MAVATPAVLREHIMVLQKIRSPDGMGGAIESEEMVGIAFGRIGTIRRTVPDIVAERLGGREPYQAIINLRISPAIRIGDILAGRDGRRYVVVSESRQDMVGIFIVTPEE